MSSTTDLATSLPAPAVPAAPAGEGRGFLAALAPYAAIARPDHWFKNVFMALGLVLAFFCHPDLFNAGAVWPVLWAVAATCVVASSNYVLNEVLDAPTDRSHPVKRHRPVPSGRVSVPLALAEWVGLGVLGLWMAAQLNAPFFWSAALLLAMGCVYNIP